ncbi:hypothetical protein C7M84_012530 [Penaeus vannamei]|uniref:Inositol 1,4,5-trisphosphate/ryanodine receptor domain-containing protein n=1 Tax=Penaeus vannamei TaxID=6689 RepID=A0A423U9W7_PENVA|nr:hypothetical protein C7M84_012530 [Penaeus vannamei]
MVCLSCTATGERVCLAAEGFGNRTCFLENIADKNNPPDLSQGVFVIEQALSVRALQELVTAAANEEVSPPLSFPRPFLSPSPPIPFPRNVPENRQAKFCQHFPRLKETPFYLARIRRRFKNKVGRENVDTEVTALLKLQGGESGSSVPRRRTVPSTCNGTGETPKGCSIRQRLEGREPASDGFDNGQEADTGGRLECIPLPPPPPASPQMNSPKCQPGGVTWLFTVPTDPPVPSGSSHGVHTAAGFLPNENRRALRERGCSIFIPAS